MSYKSVKSICNSESGSSTPSIALREIENTKRQLKISQLSCELAKERADAERNERDAQLEDELDRLRLHLNMEMHDDAADVDIRNREPSASAGSCRAEAWVSQQGWPEPASRQVQGDSWIGGVGLSGPVTADGAHRTLNATTAHCPLPRLSLESFDGNPLLWPRWIALFKALVHDRHEISDAEKLTHLQTCLKGPAREAVSGLLYDGRLYGVALRELREQFGDPAAVVRDNLDSIMRLPCIREHDYTALASLSRTLHAAVSVLQSLGYTADLAATTNMTAVVNKLPPALAWRWGERVAMLPGRKPDLAAISQWLKGQVSAARIVYGAATGVVKGAAADSQHWQEERYQTDHRQNGFRQPRARTAATSITAAVRQANSLNSCVCCGREHSLDSCVMFASYTVNDRWKLAWRCSVCFACLSVGHRMRTCELAKTCTADGCQDIHHHLLHGKTEIPRRIVPTNGASASHVPGYVQPRELTASPSGTASAVAGGATGRPADSAARSHVGAAAVPRREQVLLQVVPITAHGPRGSQRTNALLDLGSQLSLVTDGLAARLGLTGPAEPLQIATVARTETCASRRVQFGVQSLMSNEILQVMDAQTTPTLNVSGQAVDWPSEKWRWPHLAGIDLAAVTSGGIGVLLGTDAFGLIVPREVREGAEGSPSAVRTKLGWVATNRLPGEYRSTGSTGVYSTVVRAPRCEEALQKQLADFWTTESFGAKYLEPPRRTPEDSQALAMLESTIVLRDGKYSTGLLWRRADSELPDNRAAALTRLRHTERKLDLNETLSHAYTEAIEGYIRDGHACRVDPDVYPPQGARRRWYLPHHGVVTPKKPGKVRVVFDAAARFGGTSLNEHLLTGPDLTSSLIGVLLRFRQRPYPLCADIRAMYHQVGVAEQDRPALRFLWRGADRQREPDTYEMNVHVFGAASSSCAVNYALRRCATDNILDFPSAAEAVHKSFYVDDYLGSVESADEADEMQTELTDLLKRGGFELTKWVTPHKQIEGEQGSVQCDPTRDLDLDNQLLVRALGVHWDVHEDLFRFKISPMDQPSTKRGILSVVSSIFDPLGMLTPFTIRAKRLLQRLWMEGYDWDQEIDSPDIVDNWREWQQEIGDLVAFKLPRCYRPAAPPVASSQLHVFCDASETGFGAVAYLRLCLEDGQVVCSFVTSKCRVAPLRQLTIPRLELQGAVMAVRLADTIRKELDITIHSVSYWSDSKTVLRWISSESRRFHTFVANRVAEIQDSSDVSSWRHVAGVENPADVVTRGCRAETLCDEKFGWLRGPAFLWRSEESWRAEPASDEGTGNAEERVVTATADHTNERVIQPAAFSSWLKLLRVTAWISRFSRNCKAGNNHRIVGHLTAIELRAAEALWVQRAQADAFPAEIAALKADIRLPRCSPLVPLSPRLDTDGMLRVGGRLDNADLPYESRHQLLLPSSHDVTRLIVSDKHRRLAHSGPDHLLCYLRRRYWILHGRSAVKRWTAACPYCKTRRAVPSPPFMADLPVARVVSSGKTFGSIGLDFFGPIAVTRMRKTEKRYGCIFTCLTTRAVHIEVAFSLDTDSFIMALRRMFARRGRPSVIYSDNGTNLKAGERELRKCLRELNQAQVSDSMTQENIDWRFNPPAAPHFGGVWERLVRSTKRALEAIIGRHTVNDESLLTVMAEVEGLLNSRPLTHVSPHPDDLQALTPNHFLAGRACPNLPPGIFEDGDLGCRRRWRHTQRLIDHFWRRWRREYLPGLTERRKWTEDGTNLRVGEMVLVAEDDEPRGHWPLARVTRVIKSGDGRVRAAEVKTASGHYMRPTVRLCRLELDKGP